MTAIMIENSETAQALERSVRDSHPVIIKCNDAELAVISKGDLALLERYWEELEDRMDAEEIGLAVREYEEHPESCVTVEQMVERMGIDLSKEDDGS